VEHAGGVADVRWICVQQDGGVRFRRFDDFRPEQLERAAHAVERARAAGAVAHHLQVRIAFVEMHAFAGNAQFGGDDVDEGRLVTLPAGLGHGIQVQIPVRIEARKDFIAGRATGAARFEGLAMPMPRSRPARADCSRRAGNPAQSARASALSSTAANSPQS
jgi:hypothetical protein